jgi:hypothetical protein
LRFNGLKRYGELASVIASTHRCGANSDCQERSQSSNSGRSAAGSRPRALSAALLQARREDHRVHRASARAADARDLQTFVLDQRVERTPGERAV